MSVYLLTYEFFKNASEPYGIKAQSVWDFDKKTLDFKRIDNNDSEVVFNYFIKGDSSTSRPILNDNAITKFNLFGNNIPDTHKTYIRSWEKNENADYIIKDEVSMETKSIPEK